MHDQKFKLGERAKLKSTVRMRDSIHGGSIIAGKGSLVMVEEFFQSDKEAVENEYMVLKDDRIHAEFTARIPESALSKLL